MNRNLKVSKKSMVLSPITKPVLCKFWSKQLNKMTRKAQGPHQIHCRGDGSYCAHFKPCFTSKQICSPSTPSICCSHNDRHHHRKFTYHTQSWMHLELIIGIADFRASCTQTQTRYRQKRGDQASEWRILSSPITSSAISLGLHEVEFGLPSALLSTCPIPPQKHEVSPHLPSISVVPYSTVKAAGTLHR